MRKVLIIALLLCLSLGAGCGVQRPAPSPEPAPAPSVIPETSKLGFSPVDLNKAPDVIKNIASDIAKRETVTWAQVNETNYILASIGDNNTGYKIEITDVIQKVPAQDYIWIEVKGKYVKLKEGEKNGQVAVISLNPPNKVISGAGFEITRAAAAAPTTPAPTTQTPAPAPAAPAPKTTPAPAPAPTTEQGKTPADQTKKTQPSENNGENSNSR